VAVEDLVLGLLVVMDLEAPLEMVERELLRP
jgi:hypothetical protein